MHRTLESALQAAYTEVDFVQCTTCEFVFNRCYKHLDYQTEYEVGRSHSGIFKEYLSTVIERIIFNIEHKVNVVVEVGAGDCYFARKFKKLNMADYFAVDNSWWKNTCPKQPIY